MSSHMVHESTSVSLEAAARLLAAHKYRCIVRYDHFHVIRDVQEPGVFGIKAREDERHLCRLQELSSFGGDELLTAVERVFQIPSYTRTPLSLV